MRVLSDSVELAPTANLTPHPRNPRQGDVGAIHESIQENGFYGALVVQRSTGHVLVGNHRLRAAVQAGAESVPAMFVDVDDATALRILLADNRTNDLASYDEAELAALLQGIMADAGTLAGTGYDGDALDELLKDINRTFDVPEPGEQQEPHLDSDHVVEIGCSADALGRMQDTLMEWAEWHGVTVNIV